MRTAVPLLLVALLCLDGAWALRCHNCYVEAETCSGPKQCSPNATACIHAKISMTGPYIKTSVVQKYCAVSCLNPLPTTKNQLDSIQEMKTEVRCCTTDLCNTAPGRGLGAATAGMVLLAPVLAALLGGFL